MSSPAPRTPAGTNPFRTPNRVSVERLAEQAKRGLDSPTKKRAKRKKHGKKNVPSRARDSSGDPDPDDEPEGDPEDPAPDSRFEIPVLKTKAGTIRPLGDLRNVPCYECIRSIANESFAKYPNRCYDVLHETRAGTNAQCSTCARKHVSHCVPIPIEFLADSEKIYDDFEQEGHTKRVRDSATALLNRMPPEPLGKKNRTMNRGSEVPASPSPSLGITVVSEAAYGSVVKFMNDLPDSGIPSDLRKSIRKVTSDWLSKHETPDSDKE